MYRPPSVHDYPAKDTPSCARPDSTAAGIRLCFGFAAGPEHIESINPKDDHKSLIDFWIQPLRGQKSR
jgi:hypothetical protein